MYFKTFDLHGGSDLTQHGVTPYYRGLSSRSVLPYCKIACMATLLDEDFISGKDSNAVMTSMAPRTVDLERNKRELSRIPCRRLRSSLMTENLIYTCTYLFASPTSLLDEEEILDNILPLDCESEVKASVTMAAFAWITSFGKYSNPLTAWSPLPDV